MVEVSQANSITTESEMFQQSRDKTKRQNYVDDHATPEQKDNQYRLVNVDLALSTLETSLS